MARFGLKHKSRRKAGIAGFNADYLTDRTAVRQRKQMGYLRSIFSGLSLLFGGLMIYVGFHYIPAFVNPSDVIKLADSKTINSAKPALKRESIFGNIIGPYVDMFTLDRAYIQGGQSVEVRYNLPQGANMDVTIRQCRRLWIVEIFQCQIISEKVIKIDGTRGSHAFTLPSAGFYHFNERVMLPHANDPYRVIWSRRRS